MHEMTGKVVDDPISEPAAGTTLTFQSHFFFPLGKVEVSPAHFKGTLLILHFGDDDRERVTGSAVLVAPGIAIAARHVIEPEAAALAAGKINLLASGVTEQGLDLWQVKRSCLHHDSDLCILSLVRRSAMSQNATLNHASLTTRMPAIDELVMMVGFTASAPEFAGTSERVVVTGELKGSVGKVKAHHPTGRDKYMLPWPCVEVAVGASGGMSGGPAFDKNGRVFGVVCSSIGEGPEGTSYVSLLPPILGVPFLPSWPKGFHQQELSILDVRPECCSIEGRERLIPILLANGERAFSYAPWT